MLQPITEAEVRQMRDQVYGVPTTDHNWSFCGARWLKPENVLWLLKETTHPALDTWETRHPIPLKT